MSIAIDRTLDLPPGQLPVVACRSAVNRYRAGGSPDALLRCVDRYGDQLDQALAIRLAEQAAEFRRLVAELERQHGYMATTQGQQAWLQVASARAID